MKDWVSKWRRRRDKRTVSTSLSSRDSASTRIDLHFKTTIDFDAAEEELIVRSIRLVASVSLANTSGWTDIPERGIVDTGAPLSLIPRFAWEQAHYSLLSRRTFDLSMAGKTTAARLAQLTIRLRDDHNTSPPLAIKAYLLDDNTHPLLLGFEDVLTRLRLVSDYAEQVVYFEWPSDTGGA